MAAHPLTRALVLEGVPSNRALCASRVLGAGGVYLPASSGRLDLKGRDRNCTGRRAVAMGMRNRRDRYGSSMVAMAGAGSTLEKEEEKKKLPETYMEEMQEFLRKDLVHLFDEQGIDRTMYDPKVEFRDPITNYDTLDGYLFNIGMLRALFQPIFELHTVKQVSEIIFKNFPVFEAVEIFWWLKITVGFYLRILDKTMPRLVR